MPEIGDVTLAPCDRPHPDDLGALELPYRPFPQGNGWYAHYYFHPGGAPAFARLTHGDHADVWYRAAPPTDSLFPAV